MKWTILLFWFLLSSLTGSTQTIECDNFEQIGQTFFGDENPGPVASYLGNSVASNAVGDIIAIADPGYGANEEGRVRIFELNESSWVQLGQDISGYTFNDDFGYSVELSTDGMVIAIGDQGGPNSVGYTRVFEFNGSQWEQIGQSIFPGGHVSINADGTTIACSSQFETGGLIVYNYDELSDSWNQVGSQINDISSTGVNFGHDVDLNAQGDVMSCVAKDASESEFITYELQGIEWVQKGQILTFPQGTDVRLDSDGNKLVISGSIGFQQFVYNGNSWDLLGSNVEPDDIGFTVRIDATPSLDYVVMSSDIAGAGSIQLFKWYEDDWIQISQDLIGFSSASYGTDPVSINDTGEIVVVGNPFFNEAEGAATVWSINCPIEGCINSLACNFNPNATEDDGSCVFPECFRDCEGACLSDSDGDGVCDELEVPYNPDFNNNQSIGVEDMLGLLPLFGTAYGSSCPIDNDNPTVVYNPDADSNNIIGVTDMLNLFPLFGQPFSAAPCPACISGCTNAEASNYNPAATVDDGSCVFGLQGDQHTCGAANVHNPDLLYGSVTDIDGNTYRTIVIGEQEWMAENLTVEHYANGDPILNVTNGALWAGLSTGAWSYYQNDPAYECPYGKLYNEYVAIDVRNVCPTGWHAPTDDDWTILTEFLGGETVAGGKMKTVGNQYWNSPNTAATNESGFSALPGGFRSVNGSFNDSSIYGYWWGSSVEIITNQVWYRWLNVNHGLVYSSNANTFGFAIRCVKD